MTYFCFLYRKFSRNCIIISDNKIQTAKATRESGVSLVAFAVIYFLITCLSDGRLDDLPDVPCVRAGVWHPRLV